MNRTIIFAAGALCLATHVTAPAATEKDAATIVRDKFAAFNDHDAAKIQAIYAPDAELHSPDHPELRGNEPIADTYRQLFALIPDANDVVTGFDSIENRVYVQFKLTGHLSGSQDRPINARLMAVYTVRKGHIVLDDTYYDRKP